MSHPAPPNLSRRPGLDTPVFDRLYAQWSTAADQETRHDRYEQEHPEGQPSLINRIFLGGGR